MNMKEMRLKTGLTQEQVAKLLEVNQAAISLWETKQCRPARKYMPKLAKLYGVHEDELELAVKERRAKKRG